MTLAMRFPSSSLAGSYLWSYPARRYSSLISSSVRAMYACTQSSIARVNASAAFCSRGFQSCLRRGGAELLRGGGAAFLRRGWPHGNKPRPRAAAALPEPEPAASMNLQQIFRFVVDLFANKKQDNRRSPDPFIYIL